MHLFEYCIHGFHHHLACDLFVLYRFFTRTVHGVGAAWFVLFLLQLIFDRLFGAWRRLRRFDTQMSSEWAQNAHQTKDNGNDRGYEANVQDISWFEFEILRNCVEFDGDILLQRPCGPRPIKCVIRWFPHGGASRSILRSWLKSVAALFLKYHRPTTGPLRVPWSEKWPLWLLLVATRFKAQRNSVAQKYRIHRKKYI